MPLTIEQKKSLKALGHRLHPVVTVAGRGLADSVVAEIGRALRDHELVKVKFAVGDRETKFRLMAELCVLCDCELVQQIGHIALLYKENPLTSPGLSNTRRTR